MLCDITQDPWKKYIPPPGSPPHQKKSANRLVRSHEERKCLFGDRPRVVCHRVSFCTRRQQAVADVWSQIFQVDVFPVEASILVSHDALVKWF